MNELQTLIDTVVDEGILIGLKNQANGEVDIIPFVQTGPKFFVALVNALIVNESMRQWIKELIENLQESVELAEKALGPRANPMDN